MSVSDVHRWTYTSSNDEDFFISTNIDLIDLTILNEALESPRMHWARSMSVPELQTMLRNSVCFSVHKTSKDSTSATDEMVGFARLVTDKTTFVYLTDVWVAESQTGKGLGTWLISCVNEWVDLVPHLRQFFLLTGDSKAPYYARKLNMRRIEEVNAFVTMMRPGKASTFSSEASN